MPDQDFLQQLQIQAQKQAVLHEKRVFPRQFDGITSFIGNYPWQVIGILSLVTAVILSF